MTSRGRNAAIVVVVLLVLVGVSYLLISPNSLGFLNLSGSQQGVSILSGTNKVTIPSSASHSQTIQLKVGSTVSWQNTRSSGGSIGNVDPNTEGVCFSSYPASAALLPSCSNHSGFVMILPTGVTPGNSYSVTFNQVGVYQTWYIIYNPGAGLGSIGPNPYGFGGNDTVFGSYVSGPTIVVLPSSSGSQCIEYNNNSIICSTFTR